MERRLGGRRGAQFSPGGDRRMHVLLAAARRAMQEVVRPEATVQSAMLVGGGALWEPPHHSPARTPGRTYRPQ